MFLFKKKTLEKTRRATYTTIDNASKKKFKDYLNEFQEEIKFSVNSNRKIDRKYEKKLFKEIDKIRYLLNHEIWHSRKIKKKIRLLNDIKYEILDK